MEYVKSERGKEKLLFEGFVYVKQKNLTKEVVSFEINSANFDANRYECKPIFPFSQIKNPQIDVIFICRSTTFQKQHLQKLSHVSLDKHPKRCTIA